ncbi:MAG: preprotein translocase subunit SecE [Candidatus Fervidibacterota bacterium]
MLRTKSPETLVRRRVILQGEGNIVARIRQFLQECWAELKVAQRPTKQEVISYSMAVLVVILASAAYLAILDYLFAKLFALFTR